MEWVKLRNALLGVVMGIVTSPLAAVVWPIFLAWWLWCETVGRDGL